jgi:hypothetical protein
MKKKFSKAKMNYIVDVVIGIGFLVSALNSVPMIMW